MYNKIVLLSSAVLMFFSCTNEKKNTLPVIQASDKSVNIKSGGILFKNAWTISPDVKPDIYATPNKQVTFYTNTDSITITVDSGKVFDFVILLNGKDSAFTQVKYDPKAKLDIPINYLDTLKKAAAYNFSDNREVPKFFYQSQDNPNLVALRKGFKLDSIAGTGKDVDKILNLLHWIHNLIPHDGNSNNPEVKNGMSLINECKKGNRGLNCRGLATVLNECYLATGFKSRFVTCMPKDSVFNDCHVINMVFVPSLNKWIWIDPTMEAYVMNEKGEMLGIEEVRERLVTNKPLEINKNANWNNKNPETKEDYLYNYMAKNLYRIQCGLSSEYDTETWKKGKTSVSVELLPLDAYLQEPHVKKEVNEKTGVTFIYYKTNNPNLFWVKP